MNFRFQALLGAPYRGGNAAMTSSNHLISAVGNRVSVTDLIASSTQTLPIQSSSNIARLAVSPNSLFLLIIDDNSRALFINLKLGIVLHRIRFKGTVTAVRFSPNGEMVAVGVGKLVQVWRVPGLKRKEVFGFELVRTFADCGGKVMALDWGNDSEWLVVGSKDLTARLFRVRKGKDGVGLKPFLFLGHRDVIVGVFFGVDGKSREVSRVYSVARDGAVFSWGKGDVSMEKLEKDGDELGSPGTPEKEAENSVGNGNVNGHSKKRKRFCGKGGDLDEGEENVLHMMKWKLLKKNFCSQGARVSACDYHRERELLVVGFSNGVFGLYRMPDFICEHFLTISSQKITTCVFNDLGNWLVLGCAKLGQLLVWEWNSGSYILKQQGHYFDVNCLAYSADSQVLATGADDNKIKIWNVTTGTCFVTFAEHTNAVTALHFTANNNVLLSASLDGTVRAYDFFRYRNFRIFTSPSSRQFVSLTADPSGEVICAGTLDSFEIFVWSMKTGRLLDILSGHEGPVHGLMFSPTNAILASSSWDKTVRLWDVFEGKGNVERFPHTHDVLTVVYRPDGKQLAASTLDGQIHFWDPIEGILMYTIEGRRDIAVGRLMTDRRTAANSSSGKYFTTLCYSADGSYILAGGRSKYICMYDVAEQVLLRRFQITQNLSLDGVIDILNSKNMTEAGPLDLIDDYDSDTEVGVDKQTREMLGAGLPGAVPNCGRPIVRTKCLRLAPTGRTFAAATTEGVLVYSMDESFIFDPTDLDMNVTPEAVDAALKEDQPGRALLISLRLNEDSLIKKCILAVNPADIQAVARSVPFRYLKRLMVAFAELMERCPHLEFVLRWCQELCKAHRHYIKQNSRDLLPALKSLQKAITRSRQDLSDTCSSNEYMLRYLCSTSAVR
ncbi:hypothetical protein Droror1_Dr00009997 [Drosera rotundifolia]